MAKLPRVAVMFKMAGADFRTRGFLSGIHGWAEEHPGRWELVHDAHAHKHLGDYQGLLGRGSRIILAEARRLGVKYVAVGCSGHSFDIPRVREGAHVAGLLAAGHLLERDYANFGFLRLLGGYASVLIEGGFRSALRKRARGASYLYVPSHSRETARRWAKRVKVLREWLAELPKPVGIVATNDVLARHLAELCVELGLRMPDDVGLVGVGNDPAICLAPPVALTSLDMAVEMVGYRAAALLDRLLQGQARPTGNLLVRPTLVPRVSTGRSGLVADTKVADALAFIEDHSHEALLVSHVAEAVGLMQRQLLRRFRAVRNRSVVQELTRTRLRNAQDILQATTLPVGEVARAVGFRRAGHLNALFRKHHGMTATAWRRGRPAPPPFDPQDIEFAKWLLQATDLSLEMVARTSRFASADALGAAFRQRVGKWPGQWRRENRLPSREIPARVEVEFVGGPAEFPPQEPPVGMPRRGRRPQVGS
ncbi:MAG TPA: helix-turn-helix domain-containing protein [Planctomycetota bacterium]|nr:helix-turn-helix domain-containing protein [Planctomycetota bacterium]